jgi:hypothetical protein
MRPLWRNLALTVALGNCSAWSAELALVTNVEPQPLVAATERLIEALQFAGASLGEGEIRQLREAFVLPDAASAVAEIQRVLDPHCLALVHINPESRVKVAEGPAAKELVEQGWRTFLVKVHNEAGINPVLEAQSPQAAPSYQRGSGSRERPMTDEKLVAPAEVAPRFLDLAMIDRQPLKPNLSGLAVEYRIVQLFSRDRGQREATLSFHIGQGTQDLGFRNGVPMLFTCIPSVEVRLGIRDFDNSPTSAALVIRDSMGRIYPNPARRLAPDFFFHDQVYRADGDTVVLPPGEYQVTVSRGPEYLPQERSFTVDESADQQLRFRLQRWIHPAARGWYSGDHHVHAAGCAHYDSPTEGVGPQAMMRHIMGEDLNVGCVLTWGPCWYSQKENFEGQTSRLSGRNYLMRYDVEVSGFPSSHAGHLCLLRLTEDDYPGTSRIEQWPSWTLPVLAWAKGQGGVVGYAHSGWGLGLPDYDRSDQRLPPMTDAFRKLLRKNADADKNFARRREADTLPDYAMPPFDGIGANEFIVTVAHGLCDFISTVDTPAIWELNIWYHTLNCGMRARISGETDFPCIYGDRVGMGRVYVKLLPDQSLTFDDWVLGVRDGRSYCGDGRSHLLDFRVNDVAVGEPGSGGKISELALVEPGKVTVRVDTAALLSEALTPATEAIRQRRLDEKPYWDLDRCRIDSTRKVPVEVIVNGQPVARQEIVADGTTQPLEFEVDIAHSSWVAVRILPSCHTNPVFVIVDRQPIRASRRSAEWCRDAVEVCWNAKQEQIRGPEQAAARIAYDTARAIYEQALQESVGP